MATSTRSTIEMRSKLANRFYEPIVLLTAFSNIHDKIPKALDVPFNEVQSRELNFHGFVNKLGQLCDTERGGNTVTAFVVLKYPDHIEYRFASNQRDSEDYARAKTFIESVLKAVRSVDADNSQAITSDILRQSLSFTRGKVEGHTTLLKKQTALCIEACKIENTDESRSILVKLRQLQDLLRFCDAKGLDNDTFSNQCEILINTINLLYQSEVEGLIQSKTKEGRFDESECWCEFRHATGRLLSYLGAVKFFLVMRKEWPELFETFVVKYVPSSIPAPSPFKGRFRPADMSAHKIIGRMTSDTGAMASYRTHAEELQKFGLDEEIQRVASSKKFRPIVHAEVLLLESLEKDGGTRPSRFFNNYNYIGCSKPTCRLCDYYFSGHPSGVEVRRTHRNLYPYWRMPDLYEGQGLHIIKKRDEMINKILERTRKDAFRTLTDKLSERKQHDTNTEPTYPINTISDLGAEDVDFLAQSMIDLEVESSEYEAMYDSSEQVSFVGSSMNAAETDDEEEGGVQL